MTEKPENVTAQWSISLTVECPECGELIDLTDDPDFWSGGIEPGEPRKDEEVTCPCGHEFKVDFVY